MGQWFIHILGGRLNRVFGRRACPVASSSPELEALVTQAIALGDGFYEINANGTLNTAQNQTGTFTDTPAQSRMATMMNLVDSFEAKVLAGTFGTVTQN